MSGVTFVSVPGMVGTSGWAYVQMAMGFVCGYVVIGYVLIPMYYKAGVVSIYEYLDRRFGVASYRTGAWFFFVSKLLGAAVRIYLVCGVMQMLVFEVLGVPFGVNVAGMMFLVWLYTFRGGVRSIVWTDGLRTLFLVSGVGLSIFFVSRELGFGFGEMVEAVRGSEMSRVWFLDDVRDGRFFVKQFLAGLFVVVGMTGLDQDMMQLPLSCRRPGEARRNFVIAGVLQFCVILLLLSLGVLLYVFAGTQGVAGGSAAGLAGDELFPAVAVYGGLPVVVGVVFVLGLISSTYSAAGSALTALTTSFTVDVLRAGGGGSGVDSGLGAGRLTRVRKAVHAGMAVGMGLVIVAFRAVGSGSVIDAVYTLASYTYGPLLGMFAFGMLVRREVRDKWVPAVAIAAPAVCLVLDWRAEAWFGGYQFSYEILVLNALLTFGGMWALAYGKAKK